MNTPATPPVTQEMAKLTESPWRIQVPDDAPDLFKKQLRWAYPAYRAYDLWSSADGLRMSAAMSFYGMLSLAPLLLLIVVALGWWLGQSTVQATLIAQVSELIGEQGAGMLEGAITATREQSSGLLASVIAIGTLIMGATGVFAELQSALARLWIQGSATALAEPWWRTATIRLKGVGYVMAFGFLLLVSLVISSVLTFLSNWAGSYIDAKPLWGAVNFIVSLGISTAMFLGLMRMSSGPQPHWRHLLIGALIGAVLFAIGKRALAIYLADAAVVSAYGAAGSLVVVLFWIYFTSAVLLFAASCARVAAEMQGQYSAQATPPAAAAITALQNPDPQRPPMGAGQSSAVLAALSGLADDWEGGQHSTAANTPTAIHWAALLLAFSAGYTLLSQRSHKKLQAEAEHANDELAQAKALLQDQHDLLQAKTDQISDELSHAKDLLQNQHALLQATRQHLGSKLKKTRRQVQRQAFFNRHTQPLNRQLHRQQGVWQERIRQLLSALR